MKKLYSPPPDRSGESYTITNYIESPPEIEETTPCALLELISGAYDIVYMWPALTPVQRIWKGKWLQDAREQGARGSV
jgi:hypothetical protein